MIEMLGVLAIIGVLSAGGIWGYNTAAQSAKVNKLISDMSQMTVEFMRLQSKPNMGIDAIHIHQLCAIKVVPDSYCKTLLNTKVNFKGSSRYPVKTPLGGDALMSVDIYGSGGTAYINRELLNGKKVTFTGRRTDVEFFMKDFPKAACIKLMKHDWRGMASLGVFTQYGAALAELPATTSEAEIICRTGVFSIRFFFFGQRIDS